LEGVDKSGKDQIAVLFTIRGRVGRSAELGGWIIAKDIFSRIGYNKILKEEDVSESFDFRFWTDPTSELQVQRQSDYNRRHLGHHLS